MSQDNSQLINQVLFTMLGGCIACAAGFLLYSHKRTRDAKDSFTVFVSVLRGRIETQNVAEFYRRTKAEIRDAVSKVKPFITNRKALEMEDLWRDYEAIVPEEKLNQTNEDSWKNDLRLAVGDKASPPIQMPSDVLKDYYDKFSKLAR
jgi:hypothetical protein